MELSERIKNIRESLGYSQKEMAAAIETSLPSVQNYESGKSVPGGDVIKSIVKLGFNANWLLTGEGDMKRADKSAQAAVAEAEQGYGLTSDMVELVRLLDRYGNKALVENIRQRLMKIRQDTEG